MKRSIFLVGLAILVIGFAVAGCKRDTESCTPGEVQFCSCLMGSGAQICNANGDGWDDCRCGSSGNDALALAVTGHPSEQTTAEDTITIQGTTPDNRGDRGMIEVTNADFSEGEPLVIPFTVMGGSYAQEVNLSVGGNSIEVSIYEGVQVVVEVGISVDYTPWGYVDTGMGDVDIDGDMDSDADTDSDSDADTDMDSDMDSDSDSDTDTDADTDMDIDIDIDTDAIAGYTCVDASIPVSATGGRCAIIRTCCSTSGTGDCYYATDGRTFNCSGTVCDTAAMDMVSYCTGISF